MTSVVYLLDKQYSQEISDAAIARNEMFESISRIVLSVWSDSTQLH